MSRWVRGGSASASARRSKPRRGGAMAKRRMWRSQRMASLRFWWRHGQEEDMEEPGDVLLPLLVVLEGPSSQQPYLYGLPPPMLQPRMLPPPFWPLAPGMPSEEPSVSCETRCIAWTITRTWGGGYISQSPLSSNSSQPAPMLLDAEAEVLPVGCMGTTCSSSGSCWPTVRSKAMAMKPPALVLLHEEAAGWRLPEEDCSS